MVFFCVHPVYLHLSTNSNFLEKTENLTRNHAVTFRTHHIRFSPDESTRTISGLANAYLEQVEPFWRYSAATDVELINARILRRGGQKLPVVAYQHCASRETLKTRGSSVESRVRRSAMRTYRGPKQREPRVQRGRALRRRRGRRPLPPPPPPETV